MFCPVSHARNHLIFVQPRSEPREGVFLDQFLDSLAKQRREYESLCVYGRPSVGILYEGRVDVDSFVAKVA